MKIAFAAAFALQADVFDGDVVAERLAHIVDGERGAPASASRNIAGVTKVSTGISSVSVPPADAIAVNAPASADNGPARPTSASATVCTCG